MNLYGYMNGDALPALVFAAIYHDFVWLRSFLLLFTMILHGCFIFAVIYDVFAYLLLLLAMIFAWLRSF